MQNKLTSRHNPRHTLTLTKLGQTPYKCHARLVGIRLERNISPKQSWALTSNQLIFCSVLMQSAIMVIHTSRRRVHVCIRYSSHYRPYKLYVLAQAHDVRAVYERWV